MTQAFDNSECVQFSCDPKRGKMKQDYTYMFCRQRKLHKTNSLRNIKAKLTEIHSEADFRDILNEYIQWNISSFVVNESIENCSKITKSNANRIRQLPPECYEKKDMFDKTYCGCKDSSEEKKRKFFRKSSHVFMILGVISLIGNITVIFIEVRALIQKHSVATEKSLYRVLVLNLSISDMLMGFYFTFFPITLQFDKLFEFNKIPELCNFFGVISVLSSEVSVTVLVLICVYRWIGIVYPYRAIRLKVLKTIIVVMWIVWLIVALLPALSVDLVGFFFTEGIQFSNKSQSYIFFHRALKLFKYISRGASNNTVSQVIPVFRKLVDYNSPDLLYTFLNHSGIFKDDDFNYRGYYSYYYSCTIRTFIDTTFSHQYYTISILLYNFFAFIFISIACFVIYKQLARNEKSIKQNSLSEKERKLIENRKIYRRLVLVIVTDCLCWIPICVIAFSFYFESLFRSKDKSTCDKAEKFAMSCLVLVLMPINSLINPYLYSWHIWKKLLKKCKAFFLKKLTLLPSIQVLFHCF